MKFLSNSRKCFALISLLCTGALADLWSWNKTKDFFDDASGDAWNTTKDWFEKQVAAEVADGLGDLSTPGVLAQIPMGYSRTPPIRSSPKTSFIQSEVTVALYDEDGNYTQPQKFSSFQSRYNTFDQSWFGIALDTFDAEIEVDIDLSANADGDYTISLLKKAATIDGIGVAIEFQLYMTASASAEMSFTAGLELSLKSPAALMVPALDPVLDLKKSQLIGFHTDNFSLKPIFNASMPSLDFSAMLALRTVFSVDVEGLDVGALTLDLPAFDLDVQTKQNMLANCKTPPPGTPSDKIYQELIHLSASLDAKLSYELLDDEFSGPLGNWTIWNALDECYAFLPGSGSLGPVPTFSTDSVLTEKPVTTCTTGGGQVSVGSIVQSLSPGIKAGVAIGTLIGVSLIAALGFCLGRASQRHDIRKHGVESMHARADSAVGGFLHRSRRVKSEKDGFGSRMPVRQDDNDAAEVQMQQSHRLWPKRKPVPFIMVDEASIPSSADLSIGNDLPASTSSVQEPSIAWNGNHLETSRYWGPGDIALEGQGLLREHGKQARRS